jgi:hypothetical protein
VTYPVGTSGSGLQAYVYLLQPGYSDSSTATGLSSLAFPSPAFSVAPVPPPGGGGSNGTTSPGGSNGTSVAPDWSFVLGGTAYVWVPQWTTFAAGEAQCVSRGGHLASIHSASQVRACVYARMHVFVRCVGKGPRATMPHALSKSCTLPAWPCPAML